MRLLPGGSGWGEHGIILWANMLIPAARCVNPVVPPGL